jgi:hypothetical protein
MRTHHVHFDPSLEGNEPMPPPNTVCTAAHHNHRNRHCLQLWCFAVLTVPAYAIGTTTPSSAYHMTYPEHYFLRMFKLQLNAKFDCWYPSCIASIIVAVV